MRTFCIILIPVLLKIIAWRFDGVWIKPAEVPIKFPSASCNSNRLFDKEKNYQDFNNKTKLILLFF